MDHIGDIRFSRHATARCQQRGIKKNVLKVLLDHHDLDREVGGNCRVLRMSRKKARREGQRFGPQISAQLERLAVILSDTTGQVVTVFHDTGKSSRYRAGA